MPTEPWTLAKAPRAFVIAPAGFGKTELIARAVALSPRRSLVLTHTHAGVNAITARFKRLGLEKSKFEVTTIASFALRYCAAYPSLSALKTLTPLNDEWSGVYDSLLLLLSSKAIREVVANSFSEVYVDEYQDCSYRQHQIIMALADLLPCKLLGDPLQGIFEFQKEPSIDWQKDVASSFERLEDLDVPHRWSSSNPGLGEWLKALRSSLLKGEEIDFGKAPLTWLPSSPANQRAACYSAAGTSQGSCVVIAQWGPIAHSFARGMGGLLSSMEEMDCPDLMKRAQKLDEAKNGCEQAGLLLEMAGECFTGIKTELGNAKAQYEKGMLPTFKKGSVNAPILDALNRLATEATGESLWNAYRVVGKHPKARLFRHELWEEFGRSVRATGAGSTKTFIDRAWASRDKTRRTGRRPQSRTISRTLLVKGLEFDAAVVLDAHKLKVKDFYVAATRGRTALTILSATSKVTFPAPQNVL